jgi:hypothetical protein
MARGDNAPSEFGGRRGMVQAEKGDLSASERLMLMKHTGQDPDAPAEQTARSDGTAFSEGVMHWNGRRRDA